MRRYLLPAVLVAALHSSPAGAVGAGFGGSGSVDVYPDMGSCAVLTFDAPTAFAGSFSQAGWLAGPGTATRPVQGATPIVVANGTHWYGCLPDAYAGATAGYAVYTLHASAPAGDVVVVRICTVTLGRLACA